jgi:hypothetical protein
MQKASPGEFHDGSLRLSRKARLDAQYLVRLVLSLNGLAVAKAGRAHGEDHR